MITVKCCLFLDLFEKLVEGCGAFCFAAMGGMTDVDWLCGEVQF